LNTHSFSVFCVFRNIHLNILITTLFLFTSRTSSFIDHPLSHFVCSHTHIRFHETYIYTYAHIFLRVCGTTRISRWRMRAHRLYTTNHVRLITLRDGLKNGWKRELNERVANKITEFALAVRNTLLEGSFYHVKKIAPVCARFVLMPYCLPKARAHQILFFSLLVRFHRIHTHTCARAHHCWIS